MREKKSAMVGCIWLGLQCVYQFLVLAHLMVVYVGSCALNVENDQCRYYEGAEKWPFWQQVGD